MVVVEFRGYLKMFYSWSLHLYKKTCKRENKSDFEIRKSFFTTSHLISLTYKI